jgi:hypothetical protein
MEIEVKSGLKPITRRTGKDFDLEMEVVDSLFEGCDFLSWTLKKLSYESLMEINLMSLSTNYGKNVWARPYFTAIEGFAGAPDQEIELKFSHANRASVIQSTRRERRVLTIEFTLERLENDPNGLEQAVNKLLNTCSLIDEPFPIFFRFKKLLSSEVYKVLGVFSNLQFKTDSSLNSDVISGALEITVPDSKIYTNAVEVFCLTPHWERAFAFPMIFPFRFDRGSYANTQELPLHSSYRHSLPLTVVFHGELRAGTRLTNTTSGEYIELKRGIAYGEEYYCLAYDKQSLLKHGNVVYRPREELMSLQSDYLSLIPRGLERRVGADAFYLNKFVLEAEKETGYIEIWKRPYV